VRRWLCVEQDEREGFSYSGASTVLLLLFSVEFWLESLQISYFLVTAFLKKHGFHFKQFSSLLDEGEILLNPLSKNEH
jgi:hypothetical protein